MNKQSKILITGSSGLVGSSLHQYLSKYGFKKVYALSSKDCNLVDKNKVHNCFKEIQPDFVFHIAAKTLGLGGNLEFCADVLHDNVMMNTNVIESCKEFDVKKIVGMGSGCVYPDLGDEELFEDQIWSGPPHESQAAYGHSKRLMLAHLEAVKTQYGLDYAFAVSGNIYGPNDYFNVEFGNVVPSLIHKFLIAKRTNTPVEIWGTGEAIRDFSHSDDISKSLYALMKNLSGPVNVGSGHKHKIKEVIEILSDIYGADVEVIFDKSKPDGQLARYFNIDRLLDINFVPEYNLEQGIKLTSKWLEENYSKARL